MKFGAFIITFNRADILKETIAAIRRQSRPPDFFLIVDNSETQTARAVAETMSSTDVGYHAMGYNAGPAGAAHFALQWFKQNHFDWVYWGDDNDPPQVVDTFERIFKMIEREQAGIGIAAAVGQRFDFRNGKVERLKDSELRGTVEVDVLSGPSSMIINLAAIGEKTLPNPDLFFGFEEFEFALKMKKSGYRLIVEGDLMKEYRIKNNRIGYQPKRQVLRSKETLWREYYSMRNLIYLFFRDYPEHRRIALYRIFAAVVKMVFGFKYGWSWGSKNFRYQCLAVYDGLKGRLGSRNFAR